MKNLKPCPFCGNTELIMKQLNDNCWVVFCGSCGTCSGKSKYFAVAEANWNNRVNKPTGSAELLVELLQACIKEEGGEALRYNDSDKWYTTSYDCLAVKYEDDYFNVTIDKLEDIKHPRTGELIEKDRVFKELQDEKTKKIKMG